MRLIDADALLENYDLKNAVKYRNKSAEQRDKSYSTLMMYEIADMIDDAPTISPRPDWTPCAEGLPEEGQEVLFDVVCDMDIGDLYGTYKGKFEEGTFWIDEYDHESTIGAPKEIVTKWMPCPTPEPYNPDRKEDAK